MRTISLLTTVSIIWCGALWVVGSYGKQTPISIGSKITTYKTDQIEFYAFHVEQDGLFPSTSLLISDGCSVKSVGPDSSDLITGKATILGYQEGEITQARYGYITGFYQVPASKQLIIVDYENHCLRWLERKGNNWSRPFIGKCQIAGFSDDKGAERFSHPYALIQKQNEPEVVMITDWGNSAVREINIKSVTSRTLIQNSDLNGPRGLAQDSTTGDLFITTDFDVFRFNLASNTLRPLAGQTKIGFKDGDFISTMFHYTRGIVQLNEWQLAVSDGFNHRVRVLDMLTNTTHSICSGIKGSTDSDDLSKCTLDDPQSVTVINGTLIISEHKNIRIVEGTTYHPRTRPPTTLPTTTPTMTTTTNTPLPTTTDMPCISRSIQKDIPAGDVSVDVNVLPEIVLTLEPGDHIYTILTANGTEECQINIAVISPPDPSTTNQTSLSVTTAAAPKCVSKNMTADIPANFTTAQVEITPGTKLRLSEGDHVYQKSEGNITCIVRISVTNSYLPTFETTSCPKEIRVVTSNLTDLATVDLTPADPENNQRLTLPAGIYPYSLTTASGLNCTFPIMVFDHNLRRQLIFIAQYNVQCSALSDEISKSALSSVSNHNFRQIEEICGHDCKRAGGSDVTFTCSNNILTIAWETDKFYNAETTDLPADIKLRVTNRLINKGSILSVFLPSAMPPVVFPMKQSSGAYADLKLESHCTENEVYIPHTDSCA